MNCQNCNERLPLSAKSCFACGAPVARALDRTPTPLVSAPSQGPVRITTPPSALPARVRVMRGTPLLDRPFAAARQVMQLEAGQWLRVHSGQMGFYGVETRDGRRGFVDQAVTAAGEEAAALESERLHPSGEPPAVHFVSPAAVEPVSPPLSRASEPVPLRGPRADMPSTNPPITSELPFNIPMLEGERVRYRAVFLYNPEEDQELVITNRRLVITGGTIGRLPRVLHLDEIEAVRLQDSGTGSTNGEGHLWITVTGVPGALHIGGVHMPHHVRNEILAAATEARSIPRTEAPTMVIRRRKSG